MLVFVTTLHTILAVLLILVILMQPGKGADAASAFGGGASSQLFGASGPGNVLTKGTGAMAGLFMLTSVGLSYFSTQSNASGTDIHEGLQQGDEQQEGGGFGVGGTKPAATDAPSNDVTDGATAPEEKSTSAPAPAAPAAP